jgi:hypothetical protein
MNDPVCRLAYTGDVAAGQLAVFLGASEAPVSGFIPAERATQKNRQPAASLRVALKMGWRLCSSVTSAAADAPSFRQSGSDRLAGGPF